MMNSTMAMPLCATQNDQLAFLAFPAKRAAEQVNSTTEDLFKNIASIVNGILSDVLTKRSASQFIAARDSHISTYMQVMLALGSLINATVTDQVIDRLTHESLSEMEAELRDHGVAAFGEEMRDQAIFTVWTLRKINDLVVNRIAVNNVVQAAHVQTDREQATQFVSHVLYGRFHLDCLIMSLHTSTPIYPEVLDCISDGLLNMVNAYAHVKQGCDLRRQVIDEDAIHIEFDDEEQELLASSMKDAFLEA